MTQEILDECKRIVSAERDKGKSLWYLEQEFGLSTPVLSRLLNQGILSLKNAEIILMHDGKCLTIKEM